MPTIRNLTPGILHIPAAKLRLQGAATVDVPEITPEIQKQIVAGRIDTGFLLCSITQVIASDKAFVGLLRGTRNKDGEEMVNIGAIMEFGATIKHPNGATIVIPARPFLHPVMEQYKDEIKDIFAEEILGLIH